MNEVNNTLFIPLYGKAKVSRQGIILKDPAAERIWSAESFPIRGKSRSRWLAYKRWSFTSGAGSTAGSSACRAFIRIGLTATFLR